MHYKVMKEKTSISMVNPVISNFSCFLCLVGSVPCCYLGATLTEEYEQAKAEGLSPPLPLAGIILHSAVHSGKNKRLFII